MDIQREKENIKKVSECYSCEKCGGDVPFLLWTGDGFRSICARCLFFEKFPNYNFPAIA